MNKHINPIATAIVISALGFFVYNSIVSRSDPCYEPVEGKAPVYSIQKDRVCVIHYGGGFESVYFKTLEGADVASFEEIGYSHAKDKNHVYKGEEIDDAFDVETFRNIGHGYVVDKNVVSNEHYPNIPGVDPKTFVVLDGSGYYSKDASHVYYSSYGWHVLDGADADTFVLIGSEYAKDKYRAYYAGTVLDNTEGASFKLFSERFAYDTNHMFCNGELLSDLDVQSFNRIQKSDYLRDADSLYYCGTKVEGVNISDFHVLPASKESGNVISVWKDTCGTDGIVVICDGKIQEGENPSAFFSNPVSF